MKKSINYILVIFAVTLFAIYAYADGTTYSIVEPNMMTEMTQRAKHINVQKIQEIEKKSAEKYFPKNAKYLPPSQKSYSYLHDVIYTLPFDIPRVVNGKTVGILYPKGFTYHVLRYVPYDFPPLVFFNITNPEQKAWVAKYYGKNLTVNLLTTDGDLQKILAFARELKRPVYASDIRFVERFGLTHTISIVKRSKKFRDDVSVTVIGMEQIKKDLAVKKSKKVK